LDRKKLISAAAQDGISFVTGFPLVGTAFSLLSDGVLPWVDSLRSSPFLDWKLANWPSIYWQERKEALSIRYRDEWRALPQVLLMDNSTRRLPVSGFAVERVKPVFELSPSARGRTESQFERYLRFIDAAGHLYSNELNVRLVGVDAGAGSCVLTVQDVAYEDYVRTNLLLDAKASPDEASLREVIHRSGKLEVLRESPLANNLGVNALIFTADGSLITQRRSREVLVRPGEYCPSASGTVSASDVPDEPASLASIALLREASEEIGLPMVRQPAVTVLGITRELIRGGQPELFIACVVDLSRADVSARSLRARDRHERDELLFFDFGVFGNTAPIAAESDRRAFAELLDRYIQQFESRMSVPLWTALALWQRYRMSTTSRSSTITERAAD
jgi:hypothetical protein